MYVFNYEEYPHGLSFVSFQHAGQLPRRLPVRLSDGRGYNYLPKRCANTINRTSADATTASECANGDSCEYAHSVEEIIYHPQVYKTRLCEHTLDEKLKRCARTSHWIFVLRLDHLRLVPLTPCLYRYLSVSVYVNFCKVGYN